MDKSIINWLLKGDPSIRYQTKRDLLDISGEELIVEQDQIQEKGWGRRFLSYQESSGLWGGNLYGPKWISTHYTLMTLMRLGLPKENRQAKKGCKILIDKGHYYDGGINHFVSFDHSETCVTGMTLSLLCYFLVNDPRLHSLKDFLLIQQMGDGGWNCESFNGAIHSSFHTTISVLEGLRMYQKEFDVDATKIKHAQSRAHEFLLKHHLFRSDKTGEIVDQKMTRFSFPPRWKFDIMRALDYFQEIDSPHDPRFCDAITVVKKKERGGKWPLQQKYSGLIYFDMEKVGNPSRINTMRAMRILKWWSRRPDKSSCA